MSKGGAVVTAHGRDGRTVRHDVPHATGSIQRPMLQPEIEAKARLLAGDRVDAMISAVARLEEAPNLDALIATVPPGPSRSTRAQFGARLAAAAAILPAIGVVRTQARAQAVFNYKFSHSQPVDFPLHTASVQMWDAVRRESNGRLNVQIFPNGQLGSDAAVITQLRSGAIQFTTQSGATLSAVVPVTAIENLPFAYPSIKTVFAALDGNLGAYLRSEIAAKGMFCFPKMFNLGFRQVTTSTHPIRTVDDFNGLKMRTPQSKIYVDVFRALGATPAAIGFNELYTALQTKVVDAQETPFCIIESAKFYEVQKYLSVTNHSFTGWWLIANGDAWNALPPDLQAIVERNAEKYILQQRREIDLLNVAVEDKLVRQGMIVNQADDASLKARLKPVFAQFHEEFGQTAWSLLESYVGKLG